VVALDLVVAGVCSAGMFRSVVVIVKWSRARDAGTRLRCLCECGRFHGLCFRPL